MPCSDAHVRVGVAIVAACDRDSGRALQAVQPATLRRLGLSASDTRLARPAPPAGGVVAMMRDGGGGGSGGSGGNGDDRDVLSARGIEPAKHGRRGEPITSTTALSPRRGGASSERHDDAVSQLRVAGDTPSGQWRESEVRQGGRAVACD